MFNPPTPGTTFTHRTILDPAGGRARALMRVTAVRRGRVYFGFADGGRSVRWLSMDRWLDEYGEDSTGEG